MSNRSLVGADPELKEEQMSAAQDPIRAQLIEARRNQILDAAAQVFAEKGFHRATTREIASTAGISEGTIYNYFDNKESLLIGIMFRLARLESLNDELLEALQGDVRELFIALFGQRSSHIEQAQETIKAVLPGVMVNPELRERFHQQFVLRIATVLEQYIQTRIDLGHIRPVDAPLAARAIQSMFVGLLVLRIMGDETLLAGWDDVPDLLATMIFDGLSPREDEEGGGSR
jgi:TetR/AcrR family fatty acid metabolism transcriptional regulator